ncbi:chromosome segregation ATPase-like protein [Rhizobium sp. CFBP 13726]|uniref:chromosome segregation ATPase-like protein n=1 Tax=Rhizobium sp. CFBP 13726 TaxID=2775296 RepID=UPI001782AA33|nr:chromosome segregation ATPase-like protein [Rhizobium sp. CFBP 13726]MBD8650999.1 chromosome segregation ATPase-like protein [Rhizobium sp. CFBP 13726]
MLTGNIVILLFAALTVVVLIIIQTTFAVLHDRAVTAAGPTRSLESLETAIADKRMALSDIDNELGERRKALANIADVQADYDATKRQLDELNAEWLQKDDRKDEIRALREEVEAEIIQKQTIDAELSSARADLDAVHDRLAAAERLFALNDEMKREQAALETKIAEMRSEAVHLREAQERVQRLESLSQELGRDVARIEGLQRAATEQLAQMQESLSVERRATAAAHAEFTQTSAKIASAEERFRSVEGDVISLEDRRTTLLAQVARMENDVAEAGGVAGQATEDAVEERLKELKALPPVLSQMKAWNKRAAENEADAVKRVLQRLEQNGLHYDRRIVYAFHTAMKTNDTTQMAVLAGISGTGKSQLPRQYAAGMGIGFLQVPVQPRWDSPQDLMGFYNYIEKRYRPTDMARALYHLDVLNNEKSEFKDQMMMILLDEMNLARVEYYFSDFLSRLESRPPATRVGDKSLRKDAEIELEIPMPKGLDAPRIFPGYNLLFAGTMNEDESTQSLSDKVVDRANVLRFPAPTTIRTTAQGGVVTEPEALSAMRWRSWVKPISSVEGDHLVTDSVERMVGLMKGFKRPFGHRLGRAIMGYVANYSSFDRAQDLRVPLADQVEMRLLPKLRGIEVEDGNDHAFSELMSFVGDTLQDVYLAKAIEDSIRSAKEGSGQFVWNGVSR